VRSAPQCRFLLSAPHNQETLPREFDEHPCQIEKEVLRTIGLGGWSLRPLAKDTLVETAIVTLPSEASYPRNANDSADYTLHIRTSPLEIATKRIISATSYNGHFPGPLLRFKEGQQVTVDMYKRHRHHR